MGTLTFKRTLAKTLLRPYFLCLAFYPHSPYYVQIILKKIYQKQTKIQYFVHLVNVISGQCGKLIYTYFCLLNIHPPSPKYYDTKSIRMFHPTSLAAYKWNTLFSCFISYVQIMPSTWMWNGLRGTCCVIFIVCYKTFRDDQNQRLCASIISVSYTHLTLPTNREV